MHQAVVAAKIAFILRLAGPKRLRFQG